MDNGKISTHQFKVLVILTFIGTSVLNAPGAFVEKADQDGWIAAVLGIAGGLLFVSFYIIVGNQMNKMTLVEYTKKLLGRWAGGLISLAFVLFLFLNSAALLWIVGNFITTQMMPETPMIVINASFMLVIIIGSRLGLKVMGRSAELLFPWVIGGLIFLFLFLLPKTEVKNLQPVFENGIKPIIQSAALFQGFTPLTLVVFLMFFPSRVNKPQDAKKAFLIGTLTAGSLIFILTLVCIMVLGAESTTRNVYPSYILAKMISVGDFIQRIEAVLAMVWSVTVFFKTILYFHAALAGFAQSLGLKDYKPYAFPFGILVVILSQVVYPDTIYAAEWDTTTWLSYVLTFGFILPLILFIIGKFRRIDKKA